MKNVINKFNLVIIIGILNLWIKWIFWFLFESLFVIKIIKKVVVIFDEVFDVKNNVGSMGLFNIG